MKLLADENVDVRVIKALIDRGYDVLAVRAVAPGCSDREVITLAAKKQRLILTHDMDFANVLRLPIADHCGVVLLRFKEQNHRVISEHLLACLIQLTDIDMKGRLAVIKENFIRLYPK